MIPQQEVVTTETAKEAVEKYYHENNHTMPSKELLLLACGDRTIDMGDNPESTPPDPNLKHFVFYWDKFVCKYKYGQIYRHGVSP
jgi:hypothetical protein